jgi:conjugative relaxase-like TrwC/TraI family protein
VLTVAKVTAGQGGEYAEYLEAKTHGQGLGDYYLKDGDRVQAPGRWAMGAESVGCDPAGPVDGGVLRTLMEVRRPDTGGLLRAAGSTGVAVAAIDATFSAPKSVSAVWALATPALRERIEGAHERAIDRALEHSLRCVRMVRKRTDRQTVIHTRAKRLIATSWRHTTARSVGGQPPDPQLHSHVLLHGAVRAGGSVVAIDSRSWLVHRREVGAAYRTELAHGLSKLGFGIKRGTGRAGRYFEVLGVPQALVDRWSSRHHQVRKAIQARIQDRRDALEGVIASRGADAAGARRELAELETAVQLAPKLDRYLTTTTRSRKEVVRTREDLDAHWRRTAREWRFDGSSVERLRATPRHMTVASDQDLLERLTEFDARFTDRDARAVALEVSAGVPIGQAVDLLGHLDVAGQLLRLADQTKTTHRQRAYEEDTLTLARRLAAARLPRIPVVLVKREAQRLDERLRSTGARLSGEQRAALELACSDRQLVVIEGQAGSGKSTTLGAIALAHRAAGHDLVVTSTAALAAERLAGELEAVGAPARAYSTTAMRAAILTCALELSPSSTVIHDEAALACTREQHWLMQAAEQSGARLIEVGDPHQSQPVGAGGLWPHIERTAQEEGDRVELTANVRAKDPADQRDQHLFRNGETVRALEGYQERDRVHITDQRRQAEDAALDAAHADRRAGKRAIVISQTTNDHLDELNARAQAIRHQDGDLGRQGAELPERPYRLYRGDEVQIRHTIPDPEHGALRNGTTAQVTDVKRSGNQLTLRLPDGTETTLERAQIEQADIRLAYVQHPFPSQGQTTDTAHLIAGEHATQEGSYVALTRARERTDIYASSDTLAIDEVDDRLLALADSIGQSEDETPSIDTPLAHERALEAEYDLEAEPALDRDEPECENTTELERDHGPGWEL